MSLGRSGQVPPIPPLHSAWAPQIPRHMRDFVGPTASWLRHELREMLVDELSGDRLGRLGYFDQDVVHALVDDHFKRRHNREGVLWALLMFSTWHRLYVESRNPSKTPALGE